MWYLQRSSKISVLSSGKIDKYEYVTGEKILPLDQRRLVEQAKFYIFSIRKNKQKRLKSKQKIQIDAITNQNQRLEALNDNKSIDKEIFYKLVKRKLDEIKKLTYEIDYDNLTFYFKNNTAKKINDFENDIELFKKMQYKEMKLEDAKELQSIFKSNLNKISEGRFKI